MHERYLFNADLWIRSELCTLVTFTSLHNETLKKNLGIEWKDMMHNDTNAGLIRFQSQPPIKLFRFFIFYFLFF